MGEGEGGEGGKGERWGTEIWIFFWNYVNFQMGFFQCGSEDVTTQWSQASRN